jgi:hypothetical protein
MDPNETLERMVQSANEVVVGDGKGERLAELVLAMDGWLRKGGFLPKDWQHKDAFKCPMCGHPHESGDCGTCNKCGSERAEHGPRRCIRCGEPQ